MKKYIYSSIALFLLGFMVQSCFQDMDHPGFDYPEELPEKEGKIFTSFDGNGGSERFCQRFSGCG